MRILGKSLVHKLAKKLNKGHVFLILPIAFGLFAIANLTAYVYFANRAYPHTTIGSAAVGGKNFSDITSLPEAEVLPTVITVSMGDNQQTLALSVLGPSIDSQATAANLKQERSLLPFMNFLRTHRVNPVVTFDEARLKSEAERLSQSLSQAPVDARIIRNEGSFVLVPAAQGLKAEPQGVIKSLKAAVSAGVSVVSLPPIPIAPATTTEALQPAYDSLLNQRKTPLTFTYGQKSAQPSPETIGNWYTEQNGTFVLSDSLVKNYIRQLGNSWGIGVDNLDAAVAEAKKAVLSSRKLTYALTAKKILKTYRYCTALRGVDPSQLATFNAKLASVYSNFAGWSLEGQVVFEKADSGCNFTAWLAAASQMTSFGGVCDSTWSCRSGNNVIINFDRWQNATTAWNNAGGSLEDYRVMVINHETGHWLGFGHSNCSGAGQLAPVMQQQSIDLQGCKFNPWPLDSEKNSFRQRIS